MARYCQAIHGHQAIHGWPGTEKVKFRYGAGGPCDDFLISVPGVPDDELNDVEDCFHTIPSFVPNPSPQSLNPIPICVGDTRVKSKRPLTPLSTA